MVKIQAPYYPIIYVRGFAMTRGEIEATTATPYMGFNLGATKIRQLWTGEIKRHYFESPLIRLMKEHGYRDAYLDGQLLQEDLPARTIFIHRYYDDADRDFGSGKRPGIIEAAESLRQLISGARKAICGSNQDAKKEFRVYLVAHSMGGLICRALLQNEQLRGCEEAQCVDKVFTYATPHNGIDIGGFNVPPFLGIWDISNFNRDTMADYLGLENSDNVANLNGHFDANRFFCLIGTNHKDYDAALGLARKGAGPMSDGLVKITNSYVNGSPRAYVHKAHSGPVGIVNSEEGYQNLTRFLFGDMRVDGILETEQLPLPPSVQRAKDDGKNIRASYWFEATVSPRPAEHEMSSYHLTERRKASHSAVLRKFDEMMRPNDIGLDEPRWPFLFSTFLDTSRIVVGSTLVFTIEVTVSATEYEVDGFLLFKNTIPGEYLYRDTLCIRATRSDGSWRLRVSHTDEEWGERRGTEAELTERGFIVPIKSKKGFKGRLVLKLFPFNSEC